MQSSVNWSLLALVIERPSYAYELGQRFERTYGPVLTLSSISHVYTALKSLKDRSLIEEIPGTRMGGQPKPRYRATPQGGEDYVRWLVGQAAEDTRRQGLFVRQLSTLARNPHAALEILARYEQACLAQAGATRIASTDRAVDRSLQLTDRLLNEERRLALGARLAWVHYARRELNDLSDARATPR
jgi:DNA-binding PadR family transcriptional regulator